MALGSTWPLTEISTRNISWGGGKDGWYVGLTNSCNPRGLYLNCLNLLMPNINYSGRTALLTSKVAFYIFIQQIQVLNILNVIYILSVFFSSKCSLFHNSNLFGSCIIHILYTGCAKIKKKNKSGAKMLR